MAEKLSRIRSAVLPAAALARCAAVLALVLNRFANSCMCPHTATALEDGSECAPSGFMHQRAEMDVIDLVVDCLEVVALD